MTVTRTATGAAGSPEDRVEAAPEEFVVGPVRSGSVGPAGAVRRQVRPGRTPAGEPVFVGVSNGEPVRLQYDVEVYPESG